MEYREVQAIARETIAKLRKEVHSGMSLEEVRNCCEAWMFEMGADSFWYYDVGAFVFSGEETSFSASGRTYETPKRILPLPFHIWHTRICLNVTPSSEHSMQ